jgi:uncharacterized membrane protein
MRQHRGAKDDESIPVTGESKGPQRPGPSRDGVRANLLIDCASLLITVFVLVESVAHNYGPARSVGAALFLAFIPGRAIVTNLPLRLRGAQTMLSVVLSLALLTLLATVSLWSHLWHPLALAQAELIGSLVLLTFARGRRVFRLFRRNAATTDRSGQAGAPT